MNKIKTLLLFGGTGFIGRAVTEEYLKNNWRIIIFTRSNNTNEAKKKLILHGFDKCRLEEFIKNNLVLFITNIDLIDKKWSQINNWLRLFNKLNVSIPSIFHIINLIGETSGSINEILRSNTETLNNIFVLVEYLKYENKKIIFCNMGSTAEKKQSKNLSPYEKAKMIARQKIEKSNLCDYHFIANYIKGKGEQKMKSVATYLWNKLRFSNKWLFGFKIGIVDVDDLAEIIYYVPETIKNSPERHKPIEINITNGELLFGEMIKNLLPDNKRIVPRPIIPIWLEKYFLLLYTFIVPKIKPTNQSLRRLANFAKKGLSSFTRQQELKTFKTAKEIKKLALDVANYITIEKKSDLIIVDRHYSIVYILRERNEEELKQIVRKCHSS